jgi:integrase
MSSTGQLMKKCGCRNPDTDKFYNGTCPKLRRPNGAWSSDHGTWSYQLELPHTSTGARRQIRHGGFDIRDDAQAECDHATALLRLAGRDEQLRRDIADVIQTALRTGKPLPTDTELLQRIRTGANITAQMPTVGEYLTDWYTQLEKLGNHADGTLISYEGHIRVHLIPHLGDISLDQLRPRHVKAMITAILDRNRDIETAHTSDDPAVRATVCGIRPTGPATRHRIRGTLRAALNDAIVDELVTLNAAAHVKTPEQRQPPMPWTPERVTRWKQTGEIPGKIMVWTAEQAGDFLDYTAVHAADLHPMFHFIAYRGPRRGEACGLRDSEVRLDHQSARITNQITDGRNGPVHKAPKSHAGKREVFYDDDTTRVLTTYKRTRAAQKLAAGPAWPDTGLFFVRPDGRAWRPAGVTQRFNRLVRRCGLPPIRLHDLRHVAATVGLQAGIDIKVISEQLGHTTTTLTRDTYQSVVEELHRNAATAVAKAMKRKSA